MNNQIIRREPTADNPDGIDFVPEQLAIDMGIGGTSGQGTGSAGTTVAGSIVDFITAHGENPLPVKGSAGTGYYYYQPMTNDQKLALPIDTPVDTRVFVTDYNEVVDPVQDGPKQILTEADPSDETHWTAE